MSQINGNDLMMAIQAVAFKIHALEKEFEVAQGIEARDLEDLLFAYDQTATSLRKAYEDALKVSSNLPPYSELVRD